MWEDYVSLCGEAVHSINLIRQQGLIAGCHTQVRGQARYDRGGEALHGNAVG